MSTFPDGQRPGKSNFTQTCNLLNQFLKEKRSSGTIFVFLSYLPSGFSLFNLIVFVDYVPCNAHQDSLWKKNLKLALMGFLFVWLWILATTLELDLLTNLQYADDASPRQKAFLPRLLENPCINLRCVIILIVLHSKHKRRQKAGPKIL